MDWVASLQVKIWTHLCFASLWNRWAIDKLLFFYRLLEAEINLPWKEILDALEMETAFVVSGDFLCVCACVCLHVRVLWLNLFCVITDSEFAHSLSLGKNKIAVVQLSKNTLLFWWCDLIKLISRVTEQRWAHTDVCWSHSSRSQTWGLFASCARCCDCRLEPHTVPWTWAV